MSDIIHLLPDSVANQIAAGEVIQRPASVIKELMENAIDAGADTVNVIVTDAGRTSIQVIDNGKGMSETDARLAFERHATSKILNADDLFGLTTMGFRGEALASIAAVAQVELKTRMNGDDIGTAIGISASKVTSQEPTACNKGSNFKISNLFFNVPARRKFLKSNNTELNNIVTTFERIALVYPNIAFTLHSNRQELMNLRPASIKQRITDVFGKSISQELLPINVETALCKITGFTGKPEAAKKKGQRQFFFTNGRYMKHPYFHKAVASAYDRLLPEGMQPLYFIYIDVNPQEIDVNIHPTKTEIKFENEQAIWQILSAAVKDAIGKFCDIPSIDFDTEGQPQIPVFDPTKNFAQPSPHYNEQYNPFRQTATRREKSNDENWNALYQGLERQQQQPADMFGYDNIITPDSPQIIDEKSPTHYQYKGKYIMTAVKSGLMIIDQHRADIRIKYERYIAEANQHQAKTQKVLFPEILELSQDEAATVVKIIPQLAATGFDIANLGENKYAINGVPADISDTNAKVLLQNIIGEAMESEAIDSDSLRHSLALSIARHTSVTEGEILNNNEMESLVNELFACSNVNYTPDGKPILFILPQSDIETKLK